MPKRKPMIRSILNGTRRDRDQTVPAKDEVTDDVRLLREISLQVEQEKFSGSFDARRPGEHKKCLSVDKEDIHPGKSKRPAPKHNQTLKEAERAAMQKPLTPIMYRKMIKEHLEILPLVYKKMDKNNSS